MLPFASVATLTHLSSGPSSRTMERNEEDRPLLEEWPCHLLAVFSTNCAPSPRGPAPSVPLWGSLSSLALQSCCSLLWQATHSREPSWYWMTGAAGENSQHHTDLACAGPWQSYGWAGVNPWACGLSDFYSMRYSHRQTSYRPCSAAVFFHGEEIHKAQDHIYFFVNPLPTQQCKNTQKIQSSQDESSMHSTHYIDIRESPRGRCHCCAQLLYNLSVLLVL